MQNINIEIIIYNSKPFNFDINEFKKIWKDDFACFIIGSPNYFGTIVDYSEASDIVHNSKSLLIQSISEAASLTVFKSPGSLNADLACGDAQSFGMPLGFGGPNLGFLTCKKEYLRKMPGRIVGQSKDHDDNIVYTLTLTAREQHIRRELAGSNICSNHGLCALRASIYLSTIGKKGLKELGLSNIEKSHYLFDKISKIKGFSIIKEQVFFNEFVVKTEIGYTKINEVLEKNNILSFYPLENIFPDYKDHYLVNATENNTIKQIDEFAEILGSIK
jgi:glycine dehydrogenase subunit 1